MYIDWILCVSDNNNNNNNHNEYILKEKATLDKRIISLTKATPFTPPSKGYIVMLCYVDIVILHMLIWLHIIWYIHQNQKQNECWYDYVWFVILTL